MALRSRRRFLRTGSLAGLALVPGLADLLRAEETTGRRKAGKRAPRITEIERHEVLIPYREFNARTLLRYHGTKLQTRTIYIVKTDQGQEGYGEAWGPGQSAEAYGRYLGTSPFDWLDTEADLPINMALYDLMGKHLGTPAWRLIGPKVRNWVPVGAWTVSQTPKAMAAEVRHAAGLGYRWLKYHIDEVQNVVDQTAAMQKVAPRGFRIHYDFNANSDIEKVYPVLAQLERFPVAGRIEDPINPRDRDGYRLLREKCRLPILIHHGPTEFMTAGLCDGLMAGHAPIGHAAKVAAIAEHARIPFMLQQAGGTINQAFLAHEAAVFRMATIDHVDLCHLWSDDVTTRTMPVVGGGVEVPSGPGLGVQLDYDKLRRYEQTQQPKLKRFLVRIRYEGGPTIITRHDPELPGQTDSLRFLDRLLKSNIPGPEPGYANPVRSDFLDEQNFDSFDTIWRRTEDGPVVER